MRAHLFSHRRYKKVEGAAPTENVAFKSFNPSTWHRLDLDVKPIRSALKGEERGPKS